MKQPLASIAICTHNRAHLLADCLAGLAAQSAELNPFEIIVVDNASGDETSGVVQRFAEIMPMLRYVREPRIGLSYARNRATESANAPWIAYLDDDAVVLDGYSQRLMMLVNDGTFDCVAGVYEPWYRDGKRDWYLDDYGSNCSIGSQFGELPDHAFASGGVCLFRVEALQAVGGFSPDLGMAGGLMAYGEETRVQILMRERGYRIGFDPGWRVKHHVPLRKQDMMWILRSAFSRGRDSWLAFDRRVTLPAMLNIGRKLVTRPLVGLLASLKNSREWRSWRNPAISVLEPFFLTLGQFVFGLRGRKDEK